MRSNEKNTPRVYEPHSHMLNVVISYPTSCTLLHHHMKENGYNWSNSHRCTSLPTDDGDVPGVPPHSETQGCELNWIPPLGANKAGTVHVVPSNPK